MSYTPHQEDMAPLGFSSPEKGSSLYQVWTNQVGTCQIRAHRSPGNTWLDFYERETAASAWRKRISGPALPTKADFLAQLKELNWLE